MRPIWILIILMVFAGCLRSKSTGFALHIIKQRILDSISSGSGLVLHHNAVFIISDNFNGFIEMDTANFSNRFYPFYTNDKQIIQKKEQKEDFENATAIELKGVQHVLAIGSGSMRVTREKILLFPTGNPGNHQIIQAPALYELIRKTLDIGTEQLNLEASFCSTDSIYLLNRGTNQSIAMAVFAFEVMLSSGFKIMPILTVKQYSLPKLDGFNAAFSGACYLDKEHFLFCATVEKSNNWIEDGEVAGSYIGLADFNGNVIQIAPLKDKATIIRQKIESIEIETNDRDGNLHVYAIADNDDGRSTWFLIRIALR